jgi:heme/copper-type cytochrome/quinol oxidase subunit 3
MRQRVVQDVSDLPTTGFGPVSPIWWGTVAFIALEGMGFILAAGAYLYLWQINPQWPIAAPLPNHWAGTALTALLIASIWPNALADHAAKRQDLGRVRVLLIMMTAIGLFAVAIRAVEFTQLVVRWDSNAYGSVVWLILGLHAAHLITDLGDTMVLLALMYSRHVTKRRFSDVSDNAFYWYFVIASWVPLYLLVYWMPRL